MHCIKLVLVTAFVALGLSGPAIAQTSMSPVTTAVPVAVDVGNGTTIKTVRLSVLRGFANSPVFKVEVTVTDQGPDGTIIVTTRTVDLASTEVFGTHQSQAIVGVDFGSTVGIGNEDLLDVCAVVIHSTSAGDTVFSDEVCVTLTPLFPL